MSAVMTRTRRRDILAAAPCTWCGLAEHGGNCRTVWTKLAAEQAAQGLRLVVPRTAICPFCRRCVVRHCVACHAARMVEVAP